MIAGKVDTPVMIECCEHLSQQIDKKTSVGLDNAPMHRAQELIKQIPPWVQQGFIIKYVPPYAPALHLIEMLWRFMQYYWLPFSAYASFQSLVEAVEEILTRFGSEYTIAFQAA
jgi:hypothetical protein